MDYIESLINGDIEPQGNQIKLDDYIKESFLITKYMSPRIKATNIATYHAFFHLSYGQTGLGELSIPWPSVGAICCNERNTGPITKNEAIRERTKILTKLGCIEINRNRTGTNDFYVFLPSQIPFVKEELGKKLGKAKPKDKKQDVDCYNESTRRLKILTRDVSKCAYCLATLSPETYYLDHIVPRAQSGANFKNNLVSACQTCNSNKSDTDVWDFLTKNYRNGLLKQEEYLSQKEYIQNIIDNPDTGDV